jgi:hypothetical protein
LAWENIRIVSTAVGDELGKKKKKETTTNILI